MTNRYSLLTCSAGTLLMLLGLTTAAQGEDLGTKSLMTIQGKVMCMDCKMEDVAEEQPQPDGNHFYEIKHRKDGDERERQLIINMSGTGQTGKDAKVQKADDKTIHNTDDEADNLRQFTGLKQSLSVRGKDELVDKLFAQGNLHKDVSITGVVRSDQTFDVADVKIGGEVGSKDQSAPDAAQ